MIDCSSYSCEMISVGSYVINKISNDHEYHNDLWLHNLICMVSIRSSGSQRYFSFSLMEHQLKRSANYISYPIAGSISIALRVMKWTVAINRKIYEIICTC